MNFYCKLWSSVEQEFEKELRNSTKDAIEAHDTIGGILFQNATSNYRLCL